MANMIMNSEIETWLNEHNAMELYDILCENDSERGQEVIDYITDYVSDKVFLSAFEKMWMNKILRFRFVVKTFKNINAILWLTDCDEDENLWGKWLLKNIGNNINSTFICCDIVLTSLNNSAEVEDIVSAIIQDDVYDNKGMNEVFWRKDYIQIDDMDVLLNKLIKLDKILSLWYEKN